MNMMNDAANSNGDQRACNPHVISTLHVNLWLCLSDRSHTTLDDSKDPAGRELGLLLGQFAYPSFRL